MKICTRCKELKSFSEFNKYSKSSDGHQPHCRECAKEYYQGNHVKHRENVSKRKQKYQKECRKLVLEYLSSHPCIDCGEADIVVLEFDHIRDKTAPVSIMIRDGHSPKRIMEEIDKCEVRCANCHRRKTALECKSWRIDPVF